MADFAANEIETYVADPGAHGSSLLNVDRVGASTEDTWEVVFDFLRQSLPQD